MLKIKCPLDLWDEKLVSFALLMISLFHYTSSDRGNAEDWAVRRQSRSSSLTSRSPLEACTMT